MNLRGSGTGTFEHYLQLLVLSNIRLLKAFLNVFFFVLFCFCFFFFFAFSKHCLVKTF